MFLTISELLDAETVTTINNKAPGLAWRDGKLTAGATAKAVKQNEQADLSSGKGPALRDQLQDAISSHPVVKAAARPKRFSRLIVSRTANGGHYGPHVDNVLMTSPDGKMRTDISFTLFLSPPDSYEGGELIVHLPGVIETIKPAAGDLVLYPTSAIHEVAPVTHGERLVCVGWIESLIRAPNQREVLFDLENLRVSLRTRLSRQSPELLTLDKTIANLLRMSVEP